MPDFGFSPVPGMWGVAQKESSCAGWHCQTLLPPAPLAFIKSCLGSGSQSFSLSAFARLSLLSWQAHSLPVITFPVFREDWRCFCWSHGLVDRLCSCRFGQCVFLGTRKGMMAILIFRQVYEKSLKWVLRGHSHPLGPTYCPSSQPQPTPIPELNFPATCYQPCFLNTSLLTSSRPSAGILSLFLAVDLPCMHGHAHWPICRSLELSASSRCSWWLCEVPTSHLQGLFITIGQFLLSPQLEHFPAPSAEC